MALETGPFACTGDRVGTCPKVLPDGGRLRVSYQFSCQNVTKKLPPCREVVTDGTSGKGVPVSAARHRARLQGAELLAGSACEQIGRVPCVRITVGEGAPGAPRRGRGEAARV